MKPTLIIMIKEPRPGRVKTRLARDIGTVAAAGWFRHHSSALIRNLRDPRWRLVLAVAPDLACGSRVWPMDLPRMGQGRGDLGQRMARMLRSAQGGKGPVCLVGADIPSLRRSHIAHAFAALGQSDLTFGPATDGGYWLIGAKHPARLPYSLFHDVRWSSPHALADTLSTVPGKRISFVDILSDVDTIDDLRQP